MNPSPRSDPRTDQALIEAINDGNSAAFEALYRRYRDWVVRLAWRFTGNNDDALDVLQETFAYLLRKFPGFELSAKMTTFLYPVVKHLSIAARRKRGRYVSDNNLPDETIAARPQANEPARAELATVMVALPDAHREMVLMRFVDGMELAEIAHVLDLPLGTVKSRLHRALATLRQDRRTRQYFDK